MIAFSLLLALAAPPTIDGDGSSTPGLKGSRLTGQSGASIELVAVGDGDGTWWDRKGRRLRDVDVTLEPYPGDELADGGVQFCEFLFRFHAIPSPSNAEKNEDSQFEKRNGWPLGLTAKDCTTISYRKFVRAEGETTDTVAGDETLLFAKRVFLSKKTSLGSISFYMPTKEAVVEAVLKVDPAKQNPPKPLRGQFHDTQGPVSFRLEVRSERPVEVKSPFANLEVTPIAFSTDPVFGDAGGLPGIASRFARSVTPRNSFAFAEITTIDQRKLEDAYELRGSFTNAEAITLSSVAGFYAATSYGDVDFSESIQPRKPVWLNHVQFAVQQVGANGVIAGGGYNSPIVYGPRSEVTFELRRRPFETVTFANIALEPRIE